MTQPGLVAQLVERRCSNPEVVGSNPAGVKDFSFILVLISNFLLLRPVVGGKLWRAVFSLLGTHTYILYIIITKFIAIASSCQLSNLSSLVHSSLLSSKKC